ncbi:tetratricopeptide repeat protein [Anaerosporobacter faecicola]|uniref:tetratricopeptide repeat protein n=1 Tax=Anaerosporobacter faecicola TaxID=2718714 RepID=UPI0014390689|nr:tetratricopeptide repeat protein [Anaerosporobacter faecicola]
MSVKNKIIMEDSQEYIQQAKLLLGQRLYQEALLYLDKAKQIDQMETEIYITEGIIYANLEEYTRAQKSFEKAKILDRENPNIYYHLGNVAFVLDNFMEGVKNYNKAISLGYADSRIYYNLALVYEQHGNVDMAIRNYSKAIYQDPIEPSYRVRKASLYLQIGEFEEALQASKELILNCPDQFEGYHMTAGAYILLNRYDEAEEVLDKAEILFPSDTEIMFDRIRLLAVRQKSSEAITYIEKLEGMTTSDEDMRNLMVEKAKLYMQQEKLEQAAKLLEDAILYEQVEQIDTESHYYLLNIYMILGEYAKLLSHAELLTKVEPADNFSTAGWYYQAVAVKKMGMGYKKEYLEAISYYRKRTFEDSTNFDCYLFRCMCLKDIEEYDKALELVDYVMLIYKNSADLHLIRSHILRAKGEDKKAEEEIAIAKTMNPTMYIPQ